jgi:hypothetical protein
MNANRNLKIDFRINHQHDHYINDPDEKHVQPHQPRRAATKPYKLYHNEKNKKG